MLKTKNITSRILAMVLSFLMIGIIFLTPTTAFAASGLAYSMGGEFHNGADVRKACDFFALCGYKSYYTCNPTYSYISDANRLNSSILYFSAHGDQDAIYLPNNLSITDGYSGAGQKVDIRSYSLSNTQLVIYDACLTASNSDGTGINLCSTTLARGAKAVLGWTNVIGIDDAYKWQQRFQNYLALGNTINASIAQADKYNDYGNNSAIKSHRLYGNGSLVIKKAKSAVPLMEPAPTTFDINSISLSYNNLDLQALENAIKTINPNFNIKDYSVEKTSTSFENKDFVIDLYLKVNGVNSNSGYTILVTDNVATDVVDNTVQSMCKHQTVEIPEITDEIIANAYQAAAQQVIDRNDGSTIQSQTGSLFYDCNTGEYYYKVLTAYHYGTTNAVGAYNFIYNLR